MPRDTTAARLILSRVLSPSKDRPKAVSKDEPPGVSKRAGQRNGQLFETELLERPGHAGAL